MGKSKMEIKKDNLRYAGRALTLCAARQAHALRSSFREGVVWERVRERGSKNRIDTERKIQRKRKKEMHPHVLCRTAGYGYPVTVLQFNPFSNIWTAVSFNNSIPATHYPGVAATRDNLFYIFGGQTDQGKERGRAR